MTAVICEDERYWCDKIFKFLKAWTEKREIELVFHSFSKPKETIDFILTHNYIDVLFLDIALENKEMDGMTVAKIIRSQGCKVPIIFVTADEGKAVDSYLINAIGFLKKPIDKNRFSIFMDRVIQQTAYRTISIMSESGLILLQENAINYVEVNNHTIYFHTTLQIIQIRDTLTNVLEKLGSENFIQIHKSFIISKHKIYHIKTSSPYSIDIVNGSEIINLPIGRKYKDKLFEIYTNEILEQMI
jgi:DNA-binding LytR/AlgR family response regulator